VGEADRFATEKLVRFAPTAWAYEPPADAPAPAAQPPCVARGHVTFGCFNTPAKITDAMLGVWARLLAAVPTARLRLKGAGFSDAATRARYAQRFTQLGVAVERVDFLDRTAETKSHLAHYHDIDVALDTFPYHGTTTTCEALWLGVPVVVLSGDRHMSRVGVSLLAAAGHSEWAATSADDYVRLAAELARDPARLTALRAGLRDDLRRGPLLDHAAQAERFGAALRAGWVAWCARAAQAA
jgi:predicted O-linked N-acetylglucosamine transferase (SPINDLY family)